MKKMYIALLAALAFTALLAGCGSSASSQSLDESVLIGSEPQVSNGIEGDSNGPNMQRNPFENMVFGRVESIVGNEVVLELGEVDMEKLQAAMHERTQGEDGGEAVDGSERPQRTPPADGAGIPSGAGSGRQGGAPGAWEGGQRPEGGGFSQPGAGMNPSNRGGMSGGRGFLSQLEIQYDGETATYLIPVGLQIGTSDYSAITAGMVLGLTLDEEGEVASVTIINS